VSRRIRWLTVAAIVVAAGVAVAVVVTSDRTGGTVEGCPSGFVCIYSQNTGWDNGNPSNVYFHYGVYHLNDKIGTHRVFNNQYGGATIRICTDDNSTRCQRVLLASRYLDLDLTPIKSIFLVKP
jgi:hypothetical protein